jgi:hypothetical protein
MVVGWARCSWASAVKLVLASLILLGASQFPASTALAEHDEFQYKFPCIAPDPCYVTTLAHVGNAFDFDINMVVAGFNRQCYAGVPT